MMMCKMMNEISNLSRGSVLISRTFRLECWCIANSLKTASYRKRKRHSWGQMIAFDVEATLLQRLRVEQCGRQRKGARSGKPSEHRAHIVMREVFG
jgi:hypothetical protein